MKRLLIAVAIAFVALTARAESNDLRDVLLTPDGTMFTAETESSADGSGHVVMLTTNQNGAETQAVVPESLSSGFRSAPALAYDAELQTLFVFFLRMPNLASSELLLSSYHDGLWSTPVSIDNKSFRIRSNLRISVTRRVSQPQSDGTSVDVPALIVHAVWWELTGSGEEARYALIALDKGNVSNIELHNLGEFSKRTDAAVVDPDFNPEILRHPAILDNGSLNSIDVLFGNVRTNTFSRSTLRPIAQGRIHIPIGHGGGGSIGAPHAFSSAWSGRISAIGSGRDGDGRILLYNATADSVSYIMYANGAWSTIRSVPVSQKLSADGAVSVLGRMMSTNE